MTACPCGRTGDKGRVLDFDSCCGRFIGRFGDCPAPDAESLMRSRYSAFVVRDEAYLLATWHPDTRPGSVGFEPGCKWLGLEVRSHRATGEDRAEVEFVARSRIGGRAQRLHERSRFVREGGRWYYIDGEMR
jgi:SEC-C motif-containing protein